MPIDDLEAAIWRALSEAGVSNQDPGIVDDILYAAQKYARAEVIHRDDPQLCMARREALR